MAVEGCFEDISSFLICMGSCCNPLIYGRTALKIKGFYLILNKPGFGHQYFPFLKKSKKLVDTFSVRINIRQY